MRNLNPMLAIIGVVVFAILVAVVGLYAAGQNSFQEICGDAGTCPEADGADTVTLTSTGGAGEIGLTVTGDAAADTITITLPIANCPATGSAVAVMFDPTTGGLTC